MADLTALLDDLAAESDVVDALVRDLTPAEWARETPAPGWSIAFQIAHLAWTDGVAALAATDADAFHAEVGKALPRLATAVDEFAAEGAAKPPAELLADWRDGRAALTAALLATEPGTKLPWFGPPMSPASMVTARLMETWAHGQDVADALGVTREPTSRLKHVAHIGVRARGFAFGAHGKAAPADEIYVELTGPDGDEWTWGSPDAEQRVTGQALDFCLLVTQRRHRNDLGLKAIGADADTWLDIAQAFAGPPGEGRAEGQFA